METILVQKTFNFQEGEMFLMDKPFRWTSFDVVKKVKYLIRKNLGIKNIKVGHAGTLDPLATGLLIVCTGKFTKKIQDIQDLEKEYTGIIKLGSTTPSFDLETPVDKTFSFESVTEEQIRDASKKLTGTLQQIPPVFSAKKIDGKRAYEHARKRIDIEMKSSEITVKEFEITRIVLPEVHFRIVCSKGTYLRSIARDLGELLDNGGHLTQLCRTRIGGYKLEMATGMADFENFFKTD